MPIVSVILPAYNAERYIESAVRSILTQTFQDFEFIIIDDGSTDGTGQILRNLAAEDKRIRLISRPNKGFLKSLLEGMSEAHGEFIARMDADDIAAHERFEKQVAFLNAHPDVVLVGTSYDLIDANGRKLRTQHQPTDDASLQRDCLQGTTPICHPTAMFRQTAYRAAGGYDEATFPAEDIDLWLRLGEIGKLACLPDVLLKYRLHDQSISETKQQKQITALRQVCEAAAKRRGILPTFKADTGWRETGDAAKLRQTLKYGWWAFNSGERSTARAYGCDAVRLKPFSSRAWKLLLCSFVKSTPKQSA